MLPLRFVRFCFIFARSAVIAAVVAFLTSAPLRAGDIKNLRTLSIANSDLTNHGLNDICIEHPELRELNASYSKVDVLGVAPLSELKHLESLRIMGVRRPIVLESNEGDPPREHIRRIFV